MQVTLFYPKKKRKKELNLMQIIVVLNNGYFKCLLYIENYPLHLKTNGVTENNWNLKIV